MAASNGKASGDQERVKANFDDAAAEIKEDVAQLAGVWKTGKGPITKAEAGLFLWHHCYRGEDGQTEVVNAGVINTCLAILDSQESSPAEQSSAAGILLTLCEADVKHRELVCKAKAVASNACQVLHGCLSDPQAVPRHVVALLACLASDITSLAPMLKALQPEVPWSSYRSMLDVSHKDHATAMAVAKLVQMLVTGRQPLAEEAAAAGLLQALMLSITKHKSAAAVGALASCLQALCEADPANRSKLGEIPGAVQALVDLLGPPPASIVAWEQQQYNHILNPPPPRQQQQQQAGAINPTTQTSDQPSGYQRAQSKGRLSSNGMNVSQRSLSKARGSYAASKGGMTLTTPRRVGPDGEAQLLPAAPPQRTNGSMKPARSIRLPDESGSTMLLVQDPALANKRQQVSMMGTEQPGGAGRLGRTLKDPARRQSQTSNSGAANPEQSKADLPQPTRPLLCKNITSLKWEGPVLDASKSAVASVLAELVMLPEFCAAVNDRLVVPRLTSLLLGVLKSTEDASGKGKKSKKGKLSLAPESEALLTHVCACMKYLVVADNANCYRVAAAGCLPALVMLAAESKKSRLRQSAQAVLSQVCTLSEVQDLVQQAEVPEELWVQVPLRLTDSELCQLMIEYPSSTLQPLDDLTARARI